jgi:hypothetical protein
MAWGDRNSGGNEGSSFPQASYPPVPLTLGRLTIRIFVGEGERYIDRS